MWVNQNRIWTETCKLNVLSVQGGQETQAHPRSEQHKKQQAATLSHLVSRSHLLGLKVIHAFHQSHAELISAFPLCGSEDELKASSW